MFNQSASNSTSHPAWQSPVPYLFGGVAAMLGLIAIALLILVCSYWNLSGQSGESNGEGHDNNTASRECDEKDPQVLSEDTEEKVVVIMAGDETPTFLAKPAMSRNRDVVNVNV